MDPIQLRGVSKVFETGHVPVTALEPIDLDIQAGSFVSLLGPSGCGKTTLLRMIGGLEQPTETEEAPEVHEALLEGAFEFAGDDLLSQNLDKWTSTHDFLFEAGVIEEEVDPNTLFTDEFSP